MKIAVTGSNGFISKNLIYNLIENKNLEILKINRKTSKRLVNKHLLNADVICHFAGVNRPSKDKTFAKDNIGLTSYICNLLEKNKKKTKIIFSSSSQINYKNNYGMSKLLCEKILIKFAKKNSSSLKILRIPNVFGKWSKPNYNSVVATFCYNISRNKKIYIPEPSKIIKLIYVDDLILTIKKLILKRDNTIKIKVFKNTKATTINKLLEFIKKFEIQRSNYNISPFKNNFEKNLYSTYISYLPKNKISYKLKANKDKRGSFIEFLKCNEIGQFSIFTAKKKQTRGNHFHHSKVEKFFVLSGVGEFFMSDITSNKKIKIKLNANNPKVVESIPGWQHYIKNTGKNDLIVMLWSNDVFNINKPDTYRV